MSDLTNLIKRRGGIKARKTLFAGYLEDLQTNTDVKSLPKQTILQLERRLSEFENLFNTFQDIQSEIEFLGDIDEQLSEREIFENDYYELTAMCKQILCDNSSDLDIVNHSSPNSVNSVGSGCLRTHVTNIRLPQISLPKFNGDYEDWLEFRDTFESLVHKNGSLDNIQKFHYLRTSLEGDASQVIKSMEVSAVNYDAAWNLLCDRFNNKRLLIYNHLYSLHKIPSINKESASELRKLIDNTSKHLRSLESLKLPVEHWDVIIIFWLTLKLDKSSEREWEEFRTKNEFPTLTEFKAFLKGKADVLETLNKNRIDQKPISNFKPYPRKAFVSTFNNSCIFCEGAHYINQCNAFIKLSISDRVEQLKRRKACFNCLKTNHNFKDCTSSGCRKCNLKHHTLLHRERNSKGAEPPHIQENVSCVKMDTPAAVTSNPSVTMSSYNQSTNEVLLSTCLLQVLDSHGNHQTCRALLDSGSQSNFITSNTQSRLGLSTSKINLSVIGISQAASNVKERCTVNVKSCYSKFKSSLSCLVLPKICENLPFSYLKISELNIPSGLQLADPAFYESSSIDILLGAEIFYDLLCDGQIRLGVGRPILQNTKLGWIVSGSIHSNFILKNIVCNLSMNAEVQMQLAKFWEIEECPSTSSILSNDEKECESNFTSTTKRSECGKFIVSIPLKNSPTELGNSRESALKRFYSLERKLQSNSILKQMYVNFMTEYEQLGHMSKVVNSNVDIEYFLPHHGVLNEKSSTTKLRVVFDGSAKTDSGLSFNDIQRVGPTIQDDLLSIIMRFRTHKYVVCADIEKMYRMVEIDPSQRSLQRIFWRLDPSDDLNIFNLNTVTYGTASAPFLAVRCLKQLSLEHEETFPLASKVISRDFYVDDMLSGAETISKAVQLSLDVSSILKSGGFHLRKWISNSEEVLQKIQSIDSSNSIIQFGDKNDVNKTLGLYWMSKADALMFSISDTAILTKSTKRSILSQIAKIFDHMGILSPCVIIAKCLLQGLWSKGLKWDDELPLDIQKRWQFFRSQLPELNTLQIPRRVLCDSPSRIEIHGFSDASVEAYGACIYIRSVNYDGEINVSLLISKSKVAPLKTLSIPRLKLCGALVLAQLVSKVKASINLTFDAVNLWCDSTIVLCWINSEPSQLQTFVGNRVSQIQHLTNQESWNHVSTSENSADLVSRGVYPTDIKNCKMWWNGPQWLSQPEQFWPKSVSLDNIEIPEVKKVVCNLVVSQPINLFPIEQFSSFSHLVRVLSYCKRFIFNCKNNYNRQGGSLTVKELEISKLFLLKLSQQESFSEEMHCIENNKPLKGPLIGLNPFVDSNNLLRVGGRLQMSQYSDDKKHPIVLSGKHPLTKLIFLHEHKRLLHAGPQLLLASIRELYWPISGKNLAKQTIRNCVRCYRCNPKSINPLMGVLPKDRVTPTQPFSVTGIDYAGPFLIKEKKGRGSKMIKGYVCLFVCFSTKAIHLELVTDLTTEAFIATFRRFVSRRGKPSHVYSDNGTNFIGANSELKNLAEFIVKSDTKLTECFHNEGVNWHFIPSNSPHFGGLWESGVKSSKYHLKRVMANASLTFEDFCTLLTQIEAVLNSRPLTPLSTGPNDLDVLTPAHFLIGRRLTSLPDPDVTLIPEGRLSQFQRIQSLQQHFWTRWSREYIGELQQRKRWRTQTNDLELGTMVHLRDENRHPLKWKLGRIIALHPGKDGVVRVASVKTNSGVVKRACVKLCPLPIETNETN